MNTLLKPATIELLEDKGFTDNLIHDGMGTSHYNVTIAEVVMWLYEKHGVWIEVSLNQFSKPKDLQWMYSIVFTEDCTYSHSPKSYNSPTEALEAAIIYTLNKLI